MKPRRLQHACGWAIACSFTRKMWHINITQTEGRVRRLGAAVATFCPLLGEVKKTGWWEKGVGERGKGD